LLVQAFHALEMLLERREEAVREDSHPVLHPFAIAHQDGPASEIQVFDSQADSLHKAEP